GSGAWRGADAQPATTAAAVRNAKAVRPSRKYRRMMRAPDEPLRVGGRPDENVSRTHLPATVAGRNSSTASYERLRHILSNNSGRSARVTCREGRPPSLTRYANARAYEGAPLIAPRTLAGRSN